MAHHNRSRSAPQGHESEEEKKDGSAKKTFVRVAEVERLERALEQERKKSEGYLMRLKYLQADFENLQKRTKKEIEEAIKYGNEDLILSLLPVLDDLERALAASKTSGNKDAVTGGLELVLKAAQNTLYQRGVSHIDAVGKKFDPAKHEAIGFTFSSDYEDATVVREFRKGYILNNKVIRPSVVEVARRTSKEQSAESTPE